MAEAINYSLNHRTRSIKRTGKESYRCGESRMLAITPVATAAST
jgi:hypothetical protein